MSKSSATVGTTLTPERLDEIESLYRKSYDPAIAQLALDVIAELRATRETNAKLHRRCQAAEAGVKDTIAACRRAGLSFGRALANSAATMFEAERDLLLDAAADYQRAYGSALIEKDKTAARMTEREARAKLFALVRLLTDARFGKSGGQE